MGEMRSKAWSSQKISKYFQVCWAPTSAFWLYSCKITEEVKKYVSVSVFRQFTCLLKMVLLQFALGSFLKTERGSAC